MGEDRLAINKIYHVVDMRNIAEETIKLKFGLVGPAKELGNVIQVWTIIGHSRDSFYR
jgi:hypothetical protein